MSDPVSDILVVFKTHLDVGFTSLARDVVRRYLHDYIPGALRLARATRGSGNRFMWTTGSWLAWRFLIDSSASNRRLMEEAIEAGDFNWHALPFTTHTELMDPGLFSAGLQYSRRLDRRFGRKTIAAKMTDVPGHTRGIVPLLVEAGVRLLHIGVNPASTVPDVPPVFLWRAGGAEIAVIYEKVYGSLTHLPGGLCLSMNLTNDNLGPQKLDEIASTYQRLRQDFPHARVRAERLDVVASNLWKLRGSLPVVEREIGDTWIHGAGTDPFKVARFRELCRLRRDWMRKGVLVKGSKEDEALSEPLLLVAEHTWGMDIKTHLRDRRTFSRRQLAASLKRENFRLVASSWKEQRDYLTQAVDSLPATLRNEAVHRFKKMRPVRSKGGRRLATGDAFLLGRWKMTIDATGAIGNLLCPHTGSSLVSAGGYLGRLVYQTYSRADMERYYHQYCTRDEDWVRGDFQKPGLPGSAPAAIYLPEVKKLERHRQEEKVSVTMEFPPRARAFGAPKESVLHLIPRSNGLDLRLDWFDKPANRMPEALWFGFRPRLDASAKWKLEKLGLDLDPSQVVRNGNRHLHGVTGDVAAGRFSLKALDSILIAPGTPQLLNFTNRLPRPKSGISAVLFNNIWGTNFPMWHEGSDSFRFQLRWSDIGQSQS